MAVEFFYKILIVIASYLIGSFPTAYIVHKIKKGDDIRNYGSGNVGGTNVTRTLGTAYGVITIVVDAIKGFLPVLMVYLIYPADFILLSVVSVAVVLGHDFPVYIKFKGGKGIATSFGAIMGVTLLPFINISDSSVWIKVLPAVIILGTWAIIFVFFRIISLASLGGAIANPISFYLTGYVWPIVVASFCWSILTIITHRDNIKRLIQKKEKKIKG
jgi:acyl phosphate:glycerol-3-phosphate acyltransferase